ncbi:MAG: SpoIIE family protein phosphatase, partial [Candidatus Omnitrophica bacterium]|nr:SpoIIE family protein phosphatase [Candidatus Omnitrophota bacterium]
TKSILPVKSHMAPAGFPENMTGGGMDAKIPLASGDRIVFYTDGFPETPGVDGKILGIGSFKEIVEQQIHLRPADFLDEVFKAVEEYGREEPEDDRTLAIIDIK